MKRKLLIISVLFCCLLLVGCSKSDEKNVVKKLEKNLNDIKGYSLVGKMEIQNNEDKYTYDVNVSYKEKDNFRVSLKNQVNNHEQIIIKNEEGVYVLTPSLNKSFKFQSEWPYNNSQSYLIQTILKDIKNDNEKIFKETADEYIFTVKANYSNNKNLVKQTIHFDKNLNLKLVEIMNDKDQILMKMEVSNIDMKPTYKDDHFSLKGNMTVSTDIKDSEVGKIDEVIYPMYIPVNTHLSGQNQITKETGERVILTFSGEKPFMLVQETVSKEPELSITPMYGDPDMLSGTIGAISDTSVTWIDGGIEYYVVSDVLKKEELLQVAKSISVMPVGK
ncbi:MAG: hypothetical protein RRY16_02605 [Bacilli bacterium]